MTNPQFRRYRLLALIVGLLTYAVLFYATGLSFYVIWLIALGVVTFLLYGLDKLEAVRYQAQAQNRVPKLLLHLLALLGGFVGGWLGMFVFWHKIRQVEFWVVLGISTGLHLFIGQFL